MARGHPLVLGEDPASALPGGFGQPGADGLGVRPRGEPYVDPVHRRAGGVGRGDVDPVVAGADAHHGGDPQALGGAVAEPHIDGGADGVPLPFLVDDDGAVVEVGDPACDEGQFGGAGQGLRVGGAGVGADQRHALLQHVDLGPGRGGNLRTGYGPYPLDGSPVEAARPARDHEVGGGPLPDLQGLGLVQGGGGAEQGSGEGHGDEDGCGDGRRAADTRRRVLPDQHPAGAGQLGREPGDQPDQRPHQHGREQREGDDEQHRAAGVRLAVEQVRRVGEQGVPEGAEAGQQQSGAEDPAAPGHGPRLDGGFAQRLGGADPARPPRGGDDSGEGDEQAGPEGHVEGPGGVADGEPVRRDAVVHEPLGEQGRSGRPEEAARGGGHHAEEHRLGEHHAADLPRRGAGGAQQGELLAALGDGEGEGGGDDEHGDEAGDPAGGAEQGVDGEQGFGVALRVGVGVAAVPACQHPYVGVLAHGGPYGVRVRGDDQLVDGGRQPGGAGVGPEDGVLEAVSVAGGRDGADHRDGAVVGGEPGTGPGPAGGDDLVVGLRGAARVEGVGGEGGDRPGVAHQVLRSAGGADGEGPVLGGRAEACQPPGECGGDGPGVGQCAGAVSDRARDAEGVVALDDDRGLGESLRPALRGVQGGGECEAHGGDQADAEGQGDKASDEGDPAGARGAQGDAQHGAASSTVMWAAISWAVAPLSSPFRRPSARKTTRSA